jgi:hypothetical protein
VTGARRGAALVQVLVVSVLLLAAAMTVIRMLLQRNQASAKASIQSQLKLDVEGTRGAVSACLGSAGYPAGSCQPTAAQAACIPPGVTIAFSGTPPNCELQITATR